MKHTVTPEAGRPAYPTIRRHATQQDGGGELVVMFLSPTVGVILVDESPHPYRIGYSVDGLVNCDDTFTWQPATVTLSP